MDDDEPPIFDELRNGASVIQVVPGKLAELATQGEEALIAAGVPFYVHGEEIQRPVIDEVDASRGRRTSVARFATVTAHGLRDYMSRVSRWEKYVRREEEWIPTDPPREVAETIMSRQGEWQFPAAAGVITTPTLRPDGSILNEPGYDPATRLILMAPPEMPPVLETPSQEDAATALALLDALLEEFPFVDLASRSVALSGLITPVVRGGMSVVPLHAFRAPSPGTGKSYLADIGSTINSGQPCPVISAGFNEHELEKRLGAALLLGQAIVSIDNLNGELRGDFLCQMIERPTVKVRPLGVSKLVQIESKATMFANGNNLVMVGDVVRRTLLGSLDAGVERPELRQFKGNPIADVLADRGKYIAAALTVVRAYLAAGCPGELPPLASFEDWSRLVRSALVWLGRADPVDTMETAREEDPELENERRLFAAWLEATKGKPTTAGGLIELALDKEYGSDKFTYPDLHEALSNVAWRNGSINSKSLGRWLSSHRGRIIGGQKLISSSLRGQAVWSLIPVIEPAAAA